MARCRFEYDDRELRRNLRRLPSRVDGAVSAIVDRNAAWGQAHMRTNAPWTDRTSAARNGLFATPSGGGGFYEIFLSYSVHYGIWLEIANSGRYQIMTPAMRIIGEHLMQDLRRLMAML